LLRQVRANTYFLDGVSLRFEEVGVTLLVLDYALEQVLGTRVTQFVAELGSVVVLPNGVSFVSVVDLELLLYAVANLGGQWNVYIRGTIEENYSLNEAFRVVHFLDRARFG
jgi:NhaP-type Na+/H+ and K+/H+ antiporter